MYSPPVEPGPGFYGYLRRWQGGSSDWKSGQRRYSEPANAILRSTETSRSPLLAVRKIRLARTLTSCALAVSGSAATAV